MLLYGGTVTYGDERRLTKYLSNLVKQIFRRAFKLNVPIQCDYFLFIPDVHATNN